MNKKPTLQEWVAHAEKFKQPRNAMKVQTKINDWSILNTGRGIACKYLLGKGTFEICLSVSEDGEVEVQVHKEGVDAPVLIALLEE